MTDAGKQLKKSHFVFKYVQCQIYAPIKSDSCVFFKKKEKTFVKVNVTREQIVIQWQRVA